MTIPTSEQGASGNAPTPSPHLRQAHHAHNQEVAAAERDLMDALILSRATECNAARALFLAGPCRRYDERVRAAVRELRRVRWGEATR
jgi:hypothetical protein